MTPARRATFLRRVTIVFVTAWAVRSLIVSGDAVLHEHMGSVLTTSPWVVQASAGDGFEQSLVRIRTSIPSSDSVDVVWSNPHDYYYAYFWSTFWLFPRKVTVLGDFEPAQLARADVLVHVRLPNMPSADVNGFTVVDVYTFPDYVVTTYRRDG